MGWPSKPGITVKERSSRWVDPSGQTKVLVPMRLRLSEVREVTFKSLTVTL